MPLLTALATTFQVTEFDVLMIGGILVGVMVLYYFVTLHRVFEAAFGAMVGLAIYILLSVLLIGNPALGTEGGLFPFGFSAFIISISVYLVFILLILFPIHGGLVISEPTQPVLYSSVYILVSGYLIFSVIASVIYLIDQAYIFRIGTIFMYLRETEYYMTMVKNSWFYGYVMSHQNTIIPLGIVLMLYKLLLSNLVNAALLSIWYNLSHVGFYKQKDDAHYRVEFHEVGGGHGDDHGHDAHGHDDHGSHGGGHDAHGHADSGNGHGSGHH